MCAYLRRRIRTIRCPPRRAKPASKATRPKKPAEYVVDDGPVKAGSVLATCTPKTFTGEVVGTLAAKTAMGTTAGATVGGATTAAAATAAAVVGGIVGIAGKTNATGGAVVVVVVLVVVVVVVVGAGGGVNGTVTVAVVGSVSAESPVAVLV
jgi:hypothetical protein